MNIFFKFYKFVGNRRDTWFFDKGMIVDEDGNVGVVDLVPQGYNASEDFDMDTIGDASEILLTKLVEKAKGELGRIDRAINLHNIAIQNTDLKNGFLNLWSILEVLCTSDHEESKIVEIEKKLMPILQMDYISKVFQVLDIYLRTNMDKKKYQTIIRSVETKANGWHKIASIVILDDYKELREEIYHELMDYPLIRSRICQLNDRYRIKEGILTDIQKYKERVCWHLRRLYRTRNAIIHSGEEPKNLKSLGEHLHSYIDSLLFEIIVKLSEKSYLRSIDNVFVETKLNKEDVEKLFHSKEKVSGADIDKIIELLH